MNEKLKVLDLFSGIGGFTLGLERTGGFETVAFCEIDPFCQRVLKKHWPGVPIHQDVRSLTADAVGPIDIITGGFPCQDVSVAGNRAGLDGERSGLWEEYRRLIGALRPRYAIVENTPGLLSLGMDKVLGQLAALRFDAEWHCIPFAVLGAQHIRDRVWIIAYPDENRKLQPEGCQQNQRRWAGDGSKTAVPDAHQTRYAGRVQAGENGQNDGGVSPRLRLALRTAGRISRDYWDHQPVLGGRLHGVSNRFHRIAALGNSNGPQIPEVIGRAILEAEGIGA